MQTSAENTLQTERLALEKQKSKVRHCRHPGWVSLSKPAGR
jgi:hypothetical protein